MEPGQWLTVQLVNFYLFEVANIYVEQNPGSGRDLCALPESIWSGSNSSRGKYSPRPRCDTMESVLDFKFVAFAGNCTNSHYYLCIIAYASDILADRNPSGEVRTVALVLNSLKGIGPTDADNRFCNVILRLGKSRPIRKDGLKKLQVYYSRVSGPNGKRQFCVTNALFRLGTPADEHLRLWTIPRALTLYFSV